MSDVPVQDIQLAQVATVGKARAWPVYTISVEENDHEVSGNHVRICGASRQETIDWLRTAIRRLEAGKPLRIEGF